MLLFIQFFAFLVLFYIDTLTLRHFLQQNFHWHKINNFQSLNGFWCYLQKYELKLLNFLLTVKAINNHDNELLLDCEFYHNPTAYTDKIIFFFWCLHLIWQTIYKYVFVIRNPFLQKIDIEIFKILWLIFRRCCLKIWYCQTFIWLCNPFVNQKRKKFFIFWLKVIL